MTYQQLLSEIKRKRSFLCVGLDPVLSQIPTHLLAYENPILEFNKQIIDATADLAIAYKPNTAFYECMGAKGWNTLEATKNHIPKDIFTIADAKRGDIGNTSSMYADAFFKNNPGLNFDAVTVAPYMGKDSVAPFLGYENKWVILLALTSNVGHADFQLIRSDNTQLYEKVIQTANTWASKEQLMYVVGATHPEEFKNIRALAPDHFLLVPGIGAQGGDLKEVCRYGLTTNCGLIINVGRSILYASKGKDFAEQARAEALKIKAEMDDILTAAGI